MGNYNCFSWTRATPNFVLLNLFYYNGSDEIWAEYHHFLWFYRRLSEPKLSKRWRKKTLRSAKMLCDMLIISLFSFISFICHMLQEVWACTWKRPLLAKVITSFSKKGVKKILIIVYMLIMIEIHWIVILDFRVCNRKVGQCGGRLFTFFLVRVKGSQIGLMK